MPRKRKLNDDGNADINDDMDVNDDKEYDLDGLNKVTESCLRKLCQAPGCISLAAQGGGLKGYCKAHGGGKRCQAPDCTSLAPRGGGLKGYCRTHGGGKRCQAPDCTSSAQGGTGYCRRHRVHALEGSSSSPSSLASSSSSPLARPPTPVIVFTEIDRHHRNKTGIFHDHDLLSFCTSGKSN